MWAPDGRALFYNKNNQTMMVVSIATEPTFRPGPPEEVFDLTPGIQLPSRRHASVLLEESVFASAAPFTRRSNELISQATPRRAGRSPSSRPDPWRSTVGHRRAW